MKNTNSTIDRSELVDSLKRNPIIPVIKLPKTGIILELADALQKGGIKWLEITFRNEFCESALTTLKESGIPIHYGAGTVRTIEQVQKAYDAGAEFIVSPGLNENVVKKANKLGIPFFPGVDSTLGIEKAQKLKLNILKMYPANLMGGAKWCKAMAGPYFDVKFIPSGGVNLDNLADYLKQDNVLACGGSFLAPSRLLNEGRFDEITDIGKKAVEIVRSIRN
ncbi:MAG: bifunctional 4-hydroxy-2-oxoglutarate aldolase/2-dehydro-3-deoxy-phosphogluconate aldolase [Candidatus Lokiarchaeota archaeon]|nr:bifunctional 4-hydroxy-2-oxoglutarate aldolase/2-dehydro-3-deoxy-phosphogluconate aldolase [Candidatus Lokiarchaeota archaeon]